MRVGPDPTPGFIGRLDHQVQVLKRGPSYLTRLPRGDLREIYMDIVSSLPQAIRLAHELLDPDYLLFDSDHSWGDPRLIIDALQRANLPAEDHGP